MPGKGLIPLAADMICDKLYIFITISSLMFVPFSIASWKECVQHWRTSRGRRYGSASTIDWSAISWRLIFWHCDSFKKKPSLFFHQNSSSGKNYIHGCGIYMNLEIDVSIYVILYLLIKNITIYLFSNSKVLGSLEWSTCLQTALWQASTLVSKDHVVQHTLPMK